MTEFIDSLRAGMTELASEARAVDLRSRVLRSSRRLAAGRVAGAAVVAGVAAGLVTATVAVALPSQQEAPAVPPASPPTADTTVEPSSPATTGPTQTSPEQAPSAGATTTPTAEPDGPPASPEIPAAAMLQPADLGQGSRLDPDTPQHHGSLPMLMAYCGQGLAAGDPVAVRLLAFESSVDGLVGQEEASRHAGDGAALIMDELNGVLPRCQRVEVQGNPEYVSELAVTRKGFVAEESLLVAEIYTTPVETIHRYHAAIRQGDLVAFVLLETSSEDRAVEIAAAAAERLCQATTSC